MQRITTSTAVPDLHGTGKSGFRDGDKANGILPTQLNAAFFNQTQEEVANFIELLGVTLNSASKRQMYDAMIAWAKKAGIGADLLTDNPAVGDLNNLRTPGEYYYSTNANRPVANPGVIKVWRENANGVYQLAEDSVNGSPYFRRFNGSTWSAWRKLTTADDWTVTAAADGSEAAPGGIITKWGTSSIAGTGARTQVVNFASAFPNNIFQVVVSDVSNGCFSYGAGNLTLSGFTWYIPAASFPTSTTPVQTGAAVCRYVAIGN